MSALRPPSSASLSAWSESKDREGKEGSGVGDEKGSEQGVTKKTTAGEVPAEKEEDAEEEAEVEVTVCGGRGSLQVRV